MFHEIIKGYIKAFSEIGKLLFLFLLCGIIGLLIVWPLWKIAVTMPKIYTYCMLFLIVIMIIGFSFNKIYRFLNPVGLDDCEKKRRYKFVLNQIARIFVCIVGIFCFVKSVLNGSRLLGFCVLAVMAVIYGILAFGKNKKNN